MNLKIFFLLLSLVYSSNKDIRNEFQQIVNELNSKDYNPTKPEESFLVSALYFLGTPYVSGTLEVNQEEKLVVNFKELDCTTLVETCMALSRTLNKKEFDFTSYCNELQSIRYRKGIINGYTSRLHYISEWISDNEEKGILTDITQKTGGIKYLIKLSFMSDHAALYNRLKEHPERIDSIKKIEQQINDAGNRYYLPKAQIKSKESFIKDGDIICFTTSIEGLDVSHMGIAYRKDGILTFIHASSNEKKVIINPASIHEYCKRMKKNTGIMILRVNGN